ARSDPSLGAIDADRLPGPTYPDAAQRPLRARGCRRAGTHEGVERRGALMRGALVVRDSGARPEFEDRHLVVLSGTRANGASDIERRCVTKATCPRSAWRRTSAP